MRMLAEIVSKVLDSDDFSLTLKVKCATFLGAYDTRGENRKTNQDLLSILNASEWNEIRRFADTLLSDNYITKIQHLQCTGSLITVGAPPLTR